MSKGNLYIVATPIGNLEDISFRALSVLKEVDLIIAEDTRHSLSLLNHFNIQKPLESYHKFNESKKSINIISRLLEGKNIALISDAGTPGISDPGNILIKEAITNDINVIPIPGACALIQGLICSGFDTSNFSFLGFLSTTNKERKKQLEQIKNSTTEIIVLYEAPHKLEKTLQDLLNTIGDSEICISKEITKIHETHFRTTISNAIKFYSKNSPKGEYVITIKKEIEKIIYDISDKKTQEIIIDIYSSKKNNYKAKDIAKELSDKLNISKNDIYSFILKIK